MKSSDLPQFVDHPAYKHLKEGKQDMQLTGQHFKFIASVIKDLNEEVLSDYNHDFTVYFVAEWFATALAKTNPQFDRHKFLEACNV